MIPSLTNLNQDNIKALRILADSRYKREEILQNKEIDDLKINLTRVELVEHIGTAAVEELETTFG